MTGAAKTTIKRAASPPNNPPSLPVGSSQVITLAPDITIATTPLPQITITKPSSPKSQFHATTPPQDIPKPTKSPLLTRLNQEIQVARPTGFQPTPYRPSLNFLPPSWKPLPARVHHRNDNVTHYCAPGSSGWEGAQQRRVAQSQAEIGRIDKTWATSGGGAVIDFAEDRRKKRADLVRRATKKDPKEKVGDEKVNNAEGGGEVKDMIHSGVEGYVGVEVVNGKEDKDRENPLRLEKIGDIVEEFDC